MWKRTSFKGMHIPEWQGVDYKIETFPLPKKVILPMEQHHGGMCEPAVSKGEKVKTGQIIGKSDRFSVAPVHASISGTVTDILPWPEPRGRNVLSLVIESDDKDEWIETAHPDPDFLSRKPSQLLSDLRNSGIIEIGTPALPLHVKLAPPERPKMYLFLVGIPVLKKVHTLIVSAIDPEPGVYVRRAVLRNFPEEILQGIQAVRRISGVTRVVLAISENDPISTEVLKRFDEAGVELFVASGKYPSALEPILIKQFMGEEIPLPDGNCRDVGVLVQDVVTVYNLLAALRDKKPHIERLVTVWGNGISKPRLFIVRIGTPVGEIISYLGGSIPGTGKVIMGGPLMGYAQYSLNVPVTKETYGIMLQAERDVHKFSPDPCFNCGACVGVCPTNLLPNELSKYCEFGRFADAERNYVFHCIECGLCAYVCPAKRPMVHLMRYGKSEINARKVSA
ncbi:MAG: RnfABCDGE type electron transport complex subunit C [Deltaproteobacteria bacterium]|nr:RnfABCDGE type electron transport complex subunit C [Deltaproteobacteria bacterium]